MGWFLISERDVQRTKVLTEVLVDRRTTASAAAVPPISVPQTQRFLTVARAGGAKPV
jgi:hypothetical protein